MLLKLYGLLVQCGVVPQQPMCHIVLKTVGKVLHRGGGAGGMLFHSSKSVTSYSTKSPACLKCVQGVDVYCCCKWQLPRNMTVSAHKLRNQFSLDCERAPPQKK